MTYGWHVLKEELFIHEKKASLSTRQEKQKCFVELLVYLVAYSFMFSFTPCHMPGIVLGTRDKTGLMGPVLGRGPCAQSSMFYGCHFEILNFIFGFIFCK